MYTRPTLYMYMYMYVVGPSMYFSCLFENENVQRDATSERMVFDMRRPDRRTPMKVLVQKSFRFVDEIWEMFVLHNSEGTGYVLYLCTCRLTHSF